jgi:F-type H+-transporting ATPase subunit a
MTAVAVKKKMKTRTKILLFLAGFIALALIIAAFTGKGSANTSYAPQNEFRLDVWLALGGPFDITKLVLYLFLASVLTTVTMVYVGNRMQARPNRVQTAVEMAYSLMRDNITRGNMEDDMAKKWFPFVGTLFLFIWFSNMLGYIPLPTNTEHTANLFGAQVPTFALYAATANISVTFALTLVVWLSYHIVGIRRKGVVKYFKSWIPEGVQGAAVVPIFIIEIISHFVRLISLSVRLFANILAGHLLILFMGGGLVVLLGIAVLGVFTLPMAVLFYIFEVGLIATLQAFIFATLTAIYLGGAVAESH